ncbi:alpha-N-arabinofuranosidase [Psychromonas marina]|uniref:Alpha-N-arabinofuranosidase n=1 Tax=Psychromonas marina TaxID=88364 RepID=A0ABQ6E2U6_9GAMM|nr:glycoside hydrolase family 43 protein [Psychromonas marina]GLS91739.1 alpha-N-arabinofuranosidase [Psychromonas marina]
MNNTTSKETTTENEEIITQGVESTSALNAISEPLVTHIYTADPSAHVFKNKIYIYPSHDVENDLPLGDNGDHFDMRDYHVISLDKPHGKATDHGNALDVKDVKWAERQMWAPDAAEKDGKYYLYFPAKNYQGIFHIGVAVGEQPEGPFVPEDTHIAGSFSIDPAVYQDDDNQYYLLFGGISGGQLQNWREGEFGEEVYPADNEAALKPIIAKLADNMVDLAEAPLEIDILDENGDLLLAGDIDRRYFEGPWMHKHNGIYYFSYSTGDSHKIVYATSDSPYGPFNYQGVILEPVIGWTTHHSIAKFEGKWYLFYHDSSLSGGQTHLRNIKMTELTHNDDNSIATITPYLENTK